MSRLNQVNRPFSFRFMYAASRFTLDVALKVLSPRLQVQGRQHLPRRGAVILAPNHLSNIDPVLMGYTALRPLAFMAKRELFDIPFLGGLMRFAGAFPVERNTADRQALRIAAEVLDAGCPLVIFPEGQCSVDGKLQPLLAGVALLALKSRVPVIPVKIVNSQSLMPYGKVLFRPTLAEVKVLFRPPIVMNDLYEMPARQARKEFNARLDEALRKE